MRRFVYLKLHFKTSSCWLSSCNSFCNWFFYQNFSDFSSFTKQFSSFFFPFQFTIVHDFPFQNKKKLLIFRKNLSLSIKSFRKSTRKPKSVDNRRLKNFNKMRWLIIIVTRYGQMLEGQNLELSSYSIFFGY